MITNIQRFSLHDGPGIRTTVFFKGCNLRCAWCHNPETISPRPQLQFYSSKCLGCGACFEVCACHYIKDGAHKIARDACTGCGKCTEQCYSNSLTIAGQDMGARQIMDEIEKDKGFYDASGGGVTLSGGECLLQPALCTEVLRLCKNEGIHTAIDTAFHVDRDVIDMVMPYTDLFIIDVKHWDSSRHERVTGVPNEKTLDNIRYIDDKNARFIIRVPVVEEDISRTADIIREYKNILHVELLPLHKFGLGKYESLNMEYRAKNMNIPPAEKAMAHFTKTLSCPVICNQPF